MIRHSSFISPRIEDVSLSKHLYIRESRVVLDARQSILQAGGNISESDEEHFSDGSFDDVEGLEEDVTSLHSLDDQVITVLHENQKNSNKMMSTSSDD